METPDASESVEFVDEASQTGNLRYFFRTLVTIAVLCVGGAVAVKIADQSIGFAFLLMMGSLFTAWMVAP